MVSRTTRDFHCQSILRLEGNYKLGHALLSLSQLRGVSRPQSWLPHPRSRGSEARHAPPRATLTCALAGPLLRRPPHKPGRPTGRPSPTRTAFTRTPRGSRKGSVRKRRNRASGARKAWERARQNSWRPVWHVTCCWVTPL